MSTNADTRAWLQIRADSLRANYRRLRASIGQEPGILPMVKADAYGLGMQRVVEALRPEEPWGWGVATLGEGLRLRELGAEEPVVVFSPLLEVELDAALDARLQVTVPSVSGLEAVAAASRRTGAAARVHLDVDTGMGRTGLDWRAAPEWMPRVVAAAVEGVEWVGCFTHLHSAEDDRASAEEQGTRFRQVLAAVPAASDRLLVHMLNSAGAFALPDQARGVIRPGIFLYGGGIGSAHPAPEPVVSLHARVCHVRDAAVGTTLGYGATYQASEVERWATLSIGYGDGLPRSLGNRGHVLLRGRRVPIIGRISMDLTVVDISDAPGVSVGDAATLLGAEGSESITLDDVADWAGTISYEILTGFSPRLPRIWT